MQDVDDVGAASGSTKIRLETLDPRTAKNLVKVMNLVTTPWSCAIKLAKTMTAMNIERGSRSTSAATGLTSNIYSFKKEKLK